MRPALHLSQIGEADELLTGRHPLALLVGLVLDEPGAEDET